eukprot:TRINITY_DN4501_c0_g1_i3.p1 TRINITY_DN4501_c0_g1~~TRINITY_DN4501_c0_g1_i3.p1  ORF type:complete len:176 (-),score=49.97 TRINITY_DN4501_c0_g1_i3:1-486(-)
MTKDQNLESHEEHLGKDHEVGGNSKGNIAQNPQNHADGECQEIVDQDQENIEQDKVKDNSKGDSEKKIVITIDPPVDPDYDSEEESEYDSDDVGDEFFLEKKNKFTGKSYWYVPKFLLWEHVVDESLGFVKDGEIMIQARVRVAEIQEEEKFSEVTEDRIQ